MSMMTDGLTEEKRQECREEMRNLIEHMIAEDLHAVHVKHAHNTQKLHGFTRKLLMVFRENCDAVDRIKLAYPHEDLVERSLSTDDLEVFFSTIVVHCLYKPRLEALSGAIRNIEFLTKMRRTAREHLGFFIPSSSDSKYAQSEAPIMLSQHISQHIPFLTTLYNHTSLNKRATAWNNASKMLARLKGMHGQFSRSYFLHMCAHRSHLCTCACVSCMVGTHAAT